MNAKIILATSAAVIAIAGVGFEARDRAGDERVPFVNPLLLSGSVCGGEAGGPGSTRAYFLRTGRAAAAEIQTTGAVDTSITPQQTGSIAYAITTSSPLAQAHFNAGVAHMWNFNHGAAAQSFQAAQKADDQCAMCYWAEALSYGPNINAPMFDETITPAWRALKAAQARASAASEKEQALINALSYRYQSAALKDRSKLDNAFADAMDEVAKKYPDDDFIAALAAEANMDTQPWDYWEQDGRTPKGRTARTMSLLEAVLARSPEYIPAIHLYIHMTENTQNPYQATRYADRLAALSPGLGHLIHMPSHTYYRIGRFKESLGVNVEAVAADEAELAKGPAHPMYEFGYYVHNIHFVMTSAQMAGDGATALAMAKKLDEKLPVQFVEEVPFAAPIKAAPYFAMAQFAEPADILALDDPGKDLFILQGAWRYARGLAQARLGDGAAARAEAEAIARLVAETDFSVMEENRIPARDILEISRLTVLAKAAQVDGDLDGAIEAMEEAVALQDALNYTEPPYWYYPAKQTLAALVLQSGDAERAEQLFLETLVESPNNGWALYGLSEAYKAQGDKNGAKYASGLFKQAWAGDSKSLTLARL
ncbi:MAG: hypothetical protein VX640_04600 [Pseudomonadota bacterium]|nr:hypothetical protein [Pseudomonadota bacterium]